MARVDGQRCQDGIDVFVEVLRESHVVSAPSELNGTIAMPLCASSGSSTSSINRSCRSTRERTRSRIAPIADVVERRRSTPSARRRRLCLRDSRRAPERTRQSCRQRWRRICNDRGSATVVISQVEQSCTELQTRQFAAREPLRSEGPDVDNECARVLGVHEIHSYHLRHYS